MLVSLLPLFAYFLALSSLLISFDLYWFYTCYCYFVIAERLSARQLILHRILESVCMFVRLFVCHALGMQLISAHAPMMY